MQSPETPHASQTGGTAPPAAPGGRVRTAATITGAGLVLSILLGLLAGLGGYTFRYAEGLSYMSNDPEACVNCHIMRDQYQAWQASSHHAVATCNDCHVPHDFAGKMLAKAEHGWNHSRAFTMQDFHEPIAITPRSLADVQANCVRCHESTVDSLAPHVSDLETIDCVRCHQAVGHGPR